MSTNMPVTGIDSSPTCCTPTVSVSRDPPRRVPFSSFTDGMPSNLWRKVLDCPTSVYVYDVDDYKSELVQGLTSAWETAAECIKTAQGRQKSIYDCGAKEMAFKVGDRVMVHMPHESTGKTVKLARPYRILNMTPTNAEVRLVDMPDDPSIFVSLNRVRPCYAELPNRSWSGHRTKRKRRSKSSATTTADPPASPELPPYTGPVTRSRARANDGLFCCFFERVLLILLCGIQIMCLQLVCLFTTYTCMYVA